MNRIMSVLALILTFSATSVFAGTYAVDPSHTYVGFAIKHMVISSVKGNFTTLSGGFVFDEESNSMKSAELTIDAKSIFTSDAKRDKHLRSPEFLNTDKHPKITFAMKKSGSLGGSKMWVTGDLAIAGITKEIRLEGEFIGAAKDPRGNQRAGFTAKGQFDRYDYGLKWNKLLETGNMVVGKKVKLVIEVEGILQK